MLASVISGTNGVLDVHVSNFIGCSMLIRDAELLVLSAKLRMRF